MTVPGQRDPQAEQDHAEYAGWLEAQGLDDQGSFDQDDMGEAFTAGMQAQRDLAAAQASRDDAGTIRHTPTNATWVTWAKGKQPPWNLIGEAVGRLTDGAVKIRPSAVKDDDGETDPDRICVAIFRDLPELEDE